MASRWYLKTDGMDAGPMSADQLIDLLHSQLIDEADLVRPEGDTEWQSAKNAVGQFHLAHNLSEQEEVEVLVAVEDVSSPETTAPQSGIIHWLQQLIRGKEVSPVFWSMPDAKSVVAFFGQLRANLGKLRARDVRQAALATLCAIVMVAGVEIWSSRNAIRLEYEESVTQMRRVFLFERQTITRARGPFPAVLARIPPVDGVRSRRCFPFLGEYERLQYLLLLLGLAVATGAIAFSTEQLIEWSRQRRPFFHRRSLA